MGAGCEQRGGLSVANGIRSKGHCSNHACAGALRESGGLPLAGGTRFPAVPAFSINPFDVAPGTAQRLQAWISSPVVSVDFGVDGSGVRIPGFA